MKLLSDEQWNTLIRFGVTPSINLVLQRPDGSVLFVMRENEPCRGLLWVPGGRVRNGETLMDAAKRIAEAETGISASQLQDLVVLDRYQEEIFDTAGMDQAHIESNYGKGVTCIHYWGSTAFARVPMDIHITLDAQSSEYQWLTKIPHDHPIQLGYFRMLKEAGYDTLPLQ